VTLANDQQDVTVGRVMAQLTVGPSRVVEVPFLVLQRCEDPILGTAALLQADAIWKMRQGCAKLWGQWTQLSARGGSNVANRGIRVEDRDGDVWEERVTATSRGGVCVWAAPLCVSNRGIRVLDRDGDEWVEEVSAGRRGGRCVYFDQ